MHQFFLIWHFKMSLWGFLIFCLFLVEINVCTSLSIKQSGLSSISARSRYHATRSRTVEIYFLAESK